MAIHIIKISRNSSGNIDVDPDICVINPGPKPNYILLFLDESVLQQSADAKPGFDWDAGGGPPGFFDKPIPVAGENIILIKDTHIDGTSQGSWRYLPRIDGYVAQSQNQTSSCAVQYIRSEKQPIIINR